MAGRLVLQDMAEATTQDPKSSTGVEASVQYFFATQPIKGAKAYHMHSVLHNESRDRCRFILERITAIMKKGRSNILINENMTPGTSALCQNTSLDWYMIGIGGGCERTEAQWRELLISVGLKMVGS